MEADVAEFHGAPLAGFGHVGGGFGAVLDDWLSVEHLHDALRGHVGARPESTNTHAHEQGKLRDDLHGVVGEHDHVGEHGELVPEAGGVDEVSADPVDLASIRPFKDGVHQRHHERHDAVGEQLGLGEVLVGLGEFGFLVSLGIVGAHHAQAGEVLRATRLMLSVSCCMMALNFGMTMAIMMTMATNRITTAIPVASVHSKPSPAICTRPIPP